MTQEQDDQHPLLTDETEARRLLVSVPIPLTGPLTEAQREQVRAAFNAYVEKHGLKNDKVARACKYLNTQIVSQIRRGVYFHATLDEHLGTINRWMEVDARRRQGEAPKRALTTTFVVRLIKSAVDICRQNSTMGYVTGPAGVGKTVTVREISKTDPGSVYIQVNSFNCTRQSMLKELCDKLKVGDANTRKQWHGANQFERLKSVLDNSHWLLIFDDADKLRDKTLETLRELHDAFGTPILLVGVIEIAERIRASVSDDRGQLESRFGVKFDIRKAKNGGGGRGDAPIFSIDEIRKIFDRPGLRLTGGATSFLKLLANHNGLGAIRRCEHLVYMAARAVRKRESKTRNQAITISDKDLQHAVDNSDVMGFDREFYKESMRVARSA